MLTTVIVCKGQYSPPYLVDCVDQFYLFNPDARLILITDSLFPEVVSLLRRYRTLESVLTGSMLVTRRHMFFSRWNRMKRSTFRGGFWRFAIERFFVLDDLMSSTGIDNVLHFEFDNMVYASIDELGKVLVSTSRGLSLPVDAPNRCIPSVVFIRSSDDIGMFCEAYNRRYLVQGLNDMKALSRYSNRKPDRCSTLPLLPTTYRDGRTELSSLIGAKTKHFDLFDNDFEVFGGVFDAAALGQYMGGVDPRNDPPYGPGFINETAMYSPADLGLHWRRDDDGRLVPWGSYKGLDFPVFNLHIHSKNLAAFRSDRMEQ